MNKTLHLIALFVLLTSCGGAPGEAEPPHELTRVIGAKGGTIEGEAGTAFARVRLVIPEGALANDTMISILAGTDGTPLPAAAEDVGPELRLEPADLSLAIPGELTLPVDATLVDRFGLTASDCKVWVRTATSWSRVEPIATASTAVTIPISSLGVAAAGVVAISRPLSCSAACSSALSGFGACTSATGFCIDALPAPVGRPFRSFAARGTDYYYGYYDGDPSAQRIRIARTNGITGAAAQSAPYTVIFGLVVPNNLAVDALGEAWMDTGASNAHFRFDGVVDVAGYDPGHALGAALTGLGTLLELTDAGFKPHAGAATEPMETWNMLGQNGFQGHAVASEPGSDTIWTYGSSTMLDRIEIGVSDSGTGYVGDLGLSFDRDGPITAGLGSNDQAPNVAARAHGGQVVVYQTRYNAPLRALPTPFTNVFDVAFDTNGGLWASSPDTPVVFYMSPSRSISYAVLTTAPFGSTEYASMSPRTIRALSDGSMIVLTHGQQFFRLRKAS